MDRAVRRLTTRFPVRHPHRGLKNALICGGSTGSKGSLEVRAHSGGLPKHCYGLAAQNASGPIAISDGTGARDAC